MSSLQVLADTKLVVQKVDGTKETFLLSDKPEMTLQDSNCIFSTTYITVEIPRININNMHFEYETTNIETSKTGNDITVRLLNDHSVQIKGLCNQHIAVYDISGRIVNTMTSSIDNITTVSLNNVPQGVYLIRYGNNTIRILRK